jgi:hypothetical protein
MPRKTRGGHQADARGHFEAAGSADDEVAANLRFLGGADQLGRIAGKKMNRADCGVMAGQQPGKPGLVHHVAFGWRDVGLGSDLFGMAGDGGHAVAPAGELG